VVPVSLVLFKLLNRIGGEANPHWRSWGRRRSSGSGPAERTVELIDPLETASAGRGVWPVRPEHRTARQAREIPCVSSETWPDL